MPRLVAARGFAVSELRRRRLDDLREPDHGHGVLVRDLATVDLGQEGLRLLQPPELRVVVLDVARRQLLRPLDLDIVDHGGEDLLPGRVLVSDGNPDDLPALVFARFVAEADRRRLARSLELIDERRREDVESDQAAGHRAYSKPQVPCAASSPPLRSAARTGTGR